MKKNIVLIMMVCISLLFIGIKIPGYAAGEPEETFISLDFKDAGLKDVLKAFSLESGLNFIASENIQDKKITLYLDKVPLKEAMDKLFKANNLIYELNEKEKIFLVKESGLSGIETITRIYPLRYACVSSSSLKSALGVTNTTSSVTTGTGAVKSGIIEAIQQVLSKEGRVVEDRRTNSLIITDVPEKFPLFEEIIARLDVPVPQVMLEVEMLDVDRNRLERMGIKFGDITSYPSVLAMTVEGAVRTTRFPFFDMLSKEKASSSNTTSDSFGTMSFANPYQILLDLIKAQSDTRTLARPRILTLNNEPAEIKITSNEAVNEKRTKDANTGDVTVDYERMEVGVSLSIIPQINTENNEITMFLFPSVSSTKISNIASNVFDPEERSTKTLVRVKDGETIIVGGLIHQDFNQVITKVPILGDIPILGSLFRHRGINRNKDRELLVFITPHIIKDNELNKISQNILLEREQVLNSQGVVRAKAIDSFLNNLETK